MLKATRGYGYASSMAWMHSMIVLLILGLIFLLLKEKSDEFLKQQKKRERQAKARAKEKRRWEVDEKKLAKSKRKEAS